MSFRNPLPLRLGINWFIEETANPVVIETFAPPLPLLSPITADAKSDSLMLFFGNCIKIFNIWAA